MVQKIFILGDVEASQFSPRAIRHTACAMIRVTSDLEHIKLKHPEEFVDTLELFFDDLTDKTLASAMQPEHAKEIVKFVDKWKDRIYTLVVHCQGGVSRSSSIAYCIAKYLKLNHIADSILDNDRYCINMAVVEVLNEGLGLLPCTDREKKNITESIRAYYRRVGKRLDIEGLEDVTD